MESQIVNADPKYTKVNLIEPSPHGFIHIAVAMRPGGIPVVLPSADRSRLLTALKEFARQLEQLDAVVRATTFRAIIVSPRARQSAYLKERGDAIRPPNVDVVVLVETVSPAAIDEVKSTSQ